ncbi:MAG: DUF2141 domain-containing protein [Alphaproteobacteria bacterium]|jgi:uncharacterized protein (DUF2141 family)|nr:DUF2141 domain-containing protein [Alphaproteobacteria bacterium]MDP6622480.1 DUF2141 domain-containing protein [Alphaproteobacteria bacterium]|tara:strand:- start:213 stop:632 length:420 start_codon:yes stop_codon:yes gene_type:complete
MKIPIYMFVSLVAFALSGTLEAAELTVRVSGIRSAAGGIRLALFDDAGSYLKTGRSRVVAAAQGTIVARFKDLPAGSYALAVHHDENANGKMEKNLLGIPTEGYGFSNDAKALFGPPPFSQSAFALGDGQTTVDVRLSY